MISLRRHFCHYDPSFVLLHDATFSVQLRRPGDTMRTLFDVFSAIRDDEGDHVSTMKSCLDPTVAARTPSVERRLLVGGAMLAAFAYYVSTNDFQFIDFDSFGIDSLGDLGLDGILAGGAAAGQKFLEDEDSKGLIGDAMDDDAVLESASFQLRKVLTKIAELISKLF